MKTTHTEPNADAEKAAADLARAKRKQAAVKTNKNWMKTVGLLKDSPFEREAWALGEEWRRAQTDP